MSLRLTVILLAIATLGVAAETPRDTLQLDEVAVTAIKTAGVTPSQPRGAVTNISMREADRLDISSMRGASELAPNFYIPEYGSRMTSTIYVRGLGSRMDQPVVGLNVDNVPFLNKDHYDFDLSDIERVEVIRGPQCTLYGRNAMAGVVNITTLSPMRWQGVRLSVSGATRDDYRANLGIYARLSTRLAMSLSGGIKYRAGLRCNTYNDTRCGREEDFQVRWKTSWRPRAGVSIENTASFTRALQQGYPYAAEETGIICYNDTCYYKRQSVTDGLTVTWHPSDHHTVSSITSFQYLDDNMWLDQDFSPLEYFTLNQRRHEWAVTHDLVARGVHGDYGWLGGVFVFGKRFIMRAPVYFFEDGVQNLIVDRRNEMNPDYPISWDRGWIPMYSRFTSPTWGWAAYHRSTLSLGQWELAADLRLDFEHTALQYHNWCSTYYNVWHDSSLYAVMDIDIDMAGRMSKSFWQLLPKVSAERATPWGRYWATVARGYKAGGFNTQMFSDVLQQKMMEQMGITAKYDPEKVTRYDPEYSWNYEVGGALALPTLDASLNAFIIDCHNQQLTLYPDGLSTGRIMANAGHSLSWGVEAEARWHPLRRLRLNASYGLTVAKFISFHDGINDYSHKRVPCAPSNTLWGEALVDAGAGITAGVNVRGVGDIWWDEANTSHQPFYALLGATVACTRGPVTLELWGRNLTGTRYTTFRYVSVGNAYLQHGRPVQIGATLRVNFQYTRQ